MARLHSHLHRVGFLLTACAALVLVGTAQGQSTWNIDTDNSGSWHDLANWTGGVPNAADASVVFNLPLTTQAPVPGAYTISLGNVTTTVGHITANHAGGGMNNPLVSGTLVFQTTTGAATVVENAGVDDDLRNRLRFNVPVELLSDLEYTQNNDPQLNTSTEFAQKVTAAANITFTKKGATNLQFAYTGELGETEGFLGNLIIESGAVRLIGNDVENTTFRNAAGVTVLAGGQYQLGNTIPYSRLGEGAELKLNGTGKASGAMSGGALRFENTADAEVVCEFDSPVNVQSTSSIHVAAIDCTGVLTQEVRGVGELRKIGQGVLRLNAANVYTGGTGIYNGTLDVNNTTGSAVGTGDVLVSNGALTGTGIIGTSSDPSNVTLTSGTLLPGGFTAKSTIGVPSGRITSPGTLTVFGDVSFDNLSSLDIDLAGATVGTEYDQLIASGLTLGGAALNLSLPISYVPTGAEIFTIASNTGGAAVNGEFAGLAQGAQVDLAGVPFFIDYAGGDGNDIVLSASVPGDEDADFDGDGDVDGADFLTWQRGVGVGTDLSTGDANNDHVVDGADLGVWKDQFGPAAVAASAPVPEPATYILATLAAAGLAAVRRNQRAA